MPPARIERLTLKHFRGGCKPVTFEFAKDKNIVLVFGENGTGKSTLVDALDFICNGEFGSLSDRSGTTPRQHIVSLNATARDVEVEMVFGGQTWRATLQSGKPKTTPTGAPQAFILRRTDIAKVMEARASERYKTLQAYISVPKVERAESELRRAAKEVNDEVTTAVAQRRLAEETLERFWLAEGRPGESALEWAVQKTSEDTTVLSQRAAAINALIERFDQLTNARTQVIAAHRALTIAKAQTEQVKAQLEQVQDRAAGDSDTLVAVLEEAKTYFAEVAPGFDVCPVCGKSEQAKILAERVERELQRLHHLSAVRKVWIEATKNTEQAEGVLSSTRRHLRECADLFLEAVRNAPANIAALFAEMMALLSQRDGTTVKQVSAAIDAATAHRPALAAALEEDQKTLHQLNALRSNLQVLADSVGDMHDLQRLKIRLDRLLEVVESERKRYVSELMDKIATSVDQLYGHIHPDEPLGRPQFFVKTHTVGSLELKADFGDKASIPPGAYYSEAHLDTLGLCVYLALARHSGVGNALIVLDDVLTSVDDAHLDRIIDLIAEEAPNFGQMIITTHSRSWFDRMRMAKAMPADLIELYGWDLQNGIRHSRSPLMLEELRLVLDAPRFDRQAAAKAGVLLEQLLNDLTLRYGCKIARKREAVYTLGELVDAFDGRLLKSLKTEEIDAAGNVVSATELKPLIEAATDYAWVRNQVGAHFSSADVDIDDNMVREFVRRALALAEALICPQCGQLPKKDKSGEYWQCGGACGSKRLHPLRSPG
ncbi:MAG: AAA family ATPase [Caldilinea sp.]